jgi:S1-C subfamily serine protease
LKGILPKYNLLSVIQKIRIPILGLVVLTFVILGLITVSESNYPLVGTEFAIAQQNATFNSEQNSTSSIPTMIENVRDSVVGILLPGENLDPNYEYDGSGFVYDVDDDKAYVITNEHVVSNYENETVDVHFIDNGAL